MGLVQDINRLLKQRGSPMAGLGSAFVRAGRKWGVDPRLLVAIAGHESEWGTKGYAVGTNNPFGWGASQGIRFPTWEDSIYTVARGLRKGYLDEGLRSIDRISGKYAPVGAANDPTNLNQHWTDGVSAVYRQLGGGEGMVGPGAAPFRVWRAASDRFPWLSCGCP